MTKYKPFPASPQYLDTIKSMYGLATNEEACQPNIIRDFFFDKVSIAIEADAVEKEDRQVEHNGVKVNISILRPLGSKDKVLPVIIFLHGGRWVIGSYNTHKTISNKLVNLLSCCVVFVEYSLSPEAKHPVALEECYAALCWVQINAASIHVDTKKLAVAGDSAGGHFSAALTILAKERGNTGISFQVLYYPVIGVDFEAESYVENKDNAILSHSTMQYMWECYLDNVTDQGKTPTAVPIAASLELLKDLPPALIITAERDILRNEGEAYAKKLIEAGVSTLNVRYLDADHGFVSMSVQSRQAVTAISQTVDALQRHWNSLEESKI